MIKELEQELLTLVRTVPVFATKGYSVYDLDDLEARGGAPINYPIIGVGYNGVLPTSGLSATPTASNTTAAGLVEATFLIVIGIQYGYTAQDDTKPDAFELLDQIRKVVAGFKGVNSRPWRFGGERPERAASGDGVVFYSQVWQTAFVSIGNSNNS